MFADPFWIEVFTQATGFVAAAFFLGWLYLIWVCIARAWRGGDAREKIHFASGAVLVLLCPLIIADILIS